MSCAQRMTSTRNFGLITMSYALFSDKNEIIEYTNCSISTHPLSQRKKPTHAYVFTDVTENSMLEVIFLEIFVFHSIDKHEVYK